MELPPPSQLGKEYRVGQQPLTAESAERMATDGEGRNDDDERPRLPVAETAPASAMGAFGTEQPKLIGKVLLHSGPAMQEVTAALLRTQHATCTAPAAAGYRTHEHRTSRCSDQATMRFLGCTQVALVAGGCKHLGSDISKVNRALQCMTASASRPRLLVATVQD